MRMVARCLAFVAFLSLPVGLWGQPPCKDCLPPPPPRPKPGPIAPPVVSVQVAAPCAAPAGADLIYEITVENRGHGAAFSTLLRNTVPANAQFVRADPAPTVDTNELKWDLGTLPPGERRTLLMVLKATGGGDVENCIRISYEHGVCTKTRIGGPATGGPSAPMPKPDETFPPPTQLQPPKLDITGEVPARQAANTSFTAKFTVNNSGNGVARNTMFIARLPQGLAYESSTPPGTFLQESGEVRWQLGEMGPGSNKSLEVKLKGLVVGRVVVQVVAQADNQIRTDKDFAIELIGGAGMHMEIRDKGDPLFVGEQAEYQILVRNTGNIPATNVQVRAESPLELSLLTQSGPSADANFREGAPNVTWAPITLPPGQEVIYRVNAKAVRQGLAKFRAQMIADQLPSGSVLREEPTNIVQELPDAGGLITQSQKNERAVTWGQWWLLVWRRMA